METNKNSSRTKNFVAISVTVIVALVTLSVTYKAALYNNDLEFVASSVFPLIGTWMGAIIAYFFAKENFDAAAKQYDKVIDKLTPDKKLQTIKVSEAMIPFKKIQWLNYNDYLKKSILTQIIENQSMNLFNRFLFFQNNKCKLIIHRSSFDRFLSYSIHINLNNTTFNVQNLSLEDFLNTDNDRINEFIKKGVEYLKLDSCLLDAKKIFEQNTACQDIIITLNGSKDEDVLGWITDGIISENSRI